MSQTEDIGIAVKATFDNLTGDEVNTIVDAIEANATDAEGRLGTLETSSVVVDLADDEAMLLGDSDELTIVYTAADRAEITSTTRLDIKANSGGGHLIDSNDTRPLSWNTTGLFFRYADVTKMEIGSTGAIARDDITVVDDISVNLGNSNDFTMTHQSSTGDTVLTNTGAGAVMFSSASMEWLAGANLIMDSTTTSLRTYYSGSLRTYTRSDGLGLYGRLNFDDNAFAVTSNSGNPESSVVAPPGSICSDRTSGVYVKESGTGNVGWSKLLTAVSAPATAQIPVIYSDTVTDGVPVTSGFLQVYYDLATQQEIPSKVVFEFSNLAVDYLNAGVPQIAFVNSLGNQMNFGIGAGDLDFVTIFKDQTTYGMDFATKTEDATLTSRVSAGGGNIPFPTPLVGNLVNNKVSSIKVELYTTMLDAGTGAVMTHAIITLVGGYINGGSSEEQWEQSMRVNIASGDMATNTNIPWGIRLTNVAPNTSTGTGRLPVQVYTPNPIYTA